MGRQGKFPYQNIKEQCLEAKFKSLKPNQRVSSVNDIPIRIIREINTCIHNKRSASGMSAPSLRLYKTNAWQWLKKTWDTSEQSSTSDFQIGKMLLSRVPIDDWKRLGIAFVPKVANVNDAMSSSESQLEFLVPVNFVFNYEIDMGSADTRGNNRIEIDHGSSDNVEHVLDNENVPNPEEEDDSDVGELASDNNDFEHELISSSDSGEEDDGIAQANLEYGDNDTEIPEHRRKNWTQLFKHFNTLPGVRVSNDAWTVMLRGIQKHKPTLTEKDLKQLPKTGRGLNYLKNRYYDHIIFRDLTNYEPDDDEFPDSEHTQEFERWHHEENVPFPTFDEDSISGDHPDEAEQDDSDVEDEDEPFPGTGEGDEENQADDECSEEGEDNDRHRLDIDIEQDLDNDMKTTDENIDGWFDQETCYFGIENVLMGRNPGILDVRGYENVLKALATLSPSSLSDEFVDKLWDGIKETGKKPPTGNRNTEPLFVLDLFIDGVQIFKNSSKSSCTPTMGRVISIDGVNIPSRRSKPFLIGLYHGKGKPSKRAFFSDVCKELRFLHPSTVFDKNKYHRSIQVVIRAIIADAIERAWIRGCKQCNSYYSCERCRIKGEHITKEKETGKFDEQGNAITKTVKDGKIKYLEIKNKKRTDECWEDYLNIEPGEIDVEQMTHRNDFSPLTEIPGFPPVTGFALEEMHLVDGGTVPDTITVLLELKPDADRTWFEEQKKKKIRSLSEPPEPKKRKPRVTPRTAPLARQERWNHRIRKWRKYCTPFEFPRRCRTFRDFKFWKMSESRQFFMYYFIPLLAGDKAFDSEKKKLAFKFIRAYSLITGNVLEPPSENALATSRTLFKQVFIGMCKLDRKWAKYKPHATCFHLADDAENFKCHTTALSSYPYENEVRFISNWNFTGRNVPKQCANRFLLRHYNRQLKEEDDESFPEYLDKIRRNGYKLTFPPMFIHSFDAAKEIVKCESVRISTEFPNNVVRIKKFFPGSGGRKLIRNICVIQSIFMDHQTGKLKVAVRGFTTVSNVFNQPYVSSLIGAFFCTDGLLPGTEIFDFSEIDCKFFPFPIVATHPNDVKYDEGGYQQYIMMKIQHSDLY